MAETQAPPASRPPSSSSSDTSFPILALSILGILTTAILLVSYYVFVIKCCLNWRRSDIIRRLPMSRSRRLRRRGAPPPFTVYASASESRGLEESVIRDIPVVRFKGGGESGSSFFHECAVCLNEFQEDEGLRFLPRCSHLFHVDCIDTWLQSSSNCPLCRAEITRVDTVMSGQCSGCCPHHASPLRSQSVVIEVRDDDDVVGGGSGGSDSPLQTNEASIRSSAANNMPDDTLQQQQQQQQQLLSARAGGEPERAPQVRKKEVRKLNHVSSMGDECIDARRRVKEERFFSGVQPMRRSISMDSSTDTQLYAAVQEILLRQQQQCQRFLQEAPPGEGSSSSSSSSSSSRTRRGLFSFGRSSRNAVQPIQFDS